MPPPSQPLSRPRCCTPCPYVKDMPLDDEDSLIDLPDSCRLDPFADLDAAPHFADVRLGWNESGLGLTVEVKGKESSRSATRPGRDSPTA